MNQGFVNGALWKVLSFLNRYVITTSYYRNESTNVIFYKLHPIEIFLYGDCQGL